MKAWIHATSGQRWEFEGDDLKVAIVGDVAILDRERAGRENKRDHVAAIKLSDRSYILMGDAHPVDLG